MASKKTARLAEFFSKLGLITLPCFCIFGFSFFLLAASGELCSPEAIVAQQKNSSTPSLVGIAYSDPVSSFKRKLALLRKPAILILGTSRVLQFRALFFNNDEPFYNAGGIIGRVKSFSEFAKSIPTGQEPKVIILGLDQNLFNSGVIRRFNEPAKSNTAPPGWFKIYQNSWAIVYKDYFKHKFGIQQLLFKNTGQRREIGFNAFANDEGYREDGSYRYGRFLSKPATLEDRLKPTLEMAAQGQDHFAYGDTVSADSLRELVIFLEACKARNIHVVGFLPPYAHRLYDTLKHSGKHNYIFKLEPVLKPLFRQYGFDFYDFSDLASAGAFEEEIIDGYHATEKAYLRLLILMAEHSETLQKHVALERLRSLLQTSASDFQIFKD